MPGWRNEKVSAVNRMRTGERNPLARLTDSQAREIRELRANGWSHRDISALYGISQSAVHDIVKGKSYKGAGGPVEGPGRGTYRPSVMPQLCRLLHLT